MRKKFDGWMVFTPAGKPMVECGAETMKRAVELAMMDLIADPRLDAVSYEEAKTDWQAATIVGFSVHKVVVTKVN